MHQEISNEYSESVAIPTPSTQRALRTNVEKVPNYRQPSAVDKPDGIYTFGLTRPPEDASSASIGNRMLLESVIGKDDRQPVPATTQIPWRRNCALRIKAKNGSIYLGTGWFIGPRTVVTAGHCVYMHHAGGWPESVEVVPGLDGTNQPFGSSSSSRFRAVDGWIQEQAPEADYGAIILTSDLGNQTGWYAFGSYADEELQTTEANIAGYPADKDNGLRQYFHARRIQSLTPKRLQYDIDTFGGQSGSCIWLNIEGQERVGIGIHTTGSSRSNYGTRIYGEVFDNLKKWKLET
jgi:glutamyl endopeptidase